MYLLNTFQKFTSDPRSFQASTRYSFSSEWKKRIQYCMQNFTQAFIKFIYIGIIIKYKVIKWILNIRQISLYVTWTEITEFHINLFRAIYFETNSVRVLGATMRVENYREILSMLFFADVIYLVNISIVVKNIMIG